MVGIGRAGGAQIEFCKVVKASPLHSMITQKLSGLFGEIGELEGGQETIERC